MSTICNYAVLRFQPYPETGEFANLGVVMLCSNGLFISKIETRSFKRVTQFFENLDKNTFLNARRIYANEVNRVRDIIHEHMDDRATQRAIFKHLIGPSETMFRFSAPGTVCAEQPEKTLEKLFQSYVHHDFGSRQDPEQQLTQQINRVLKGLEGRSYDKGTLEAGYYKINFPFLWHQGAIARQAIKPITFDLDDPSSIIEKGDKWLAKIDRLLRAGAAPQDAVFISRAPRETAGPIYKAYQDVIKELVTKPNTRLIPANLDKIAMQKAIVEPQSIH